MEQPLGNKIARARNKQAAFRLGKRWRAKATGEGEEAEDATGDGMAADDGLLGDGAKLDEECVWGRGSYVPCPPRVRVGRS